MLGSIDTRVNETATGPDEPAITAITAMTAVSAAGGQ
jgi:hypothetical protein